MFGQSTQWAAQWITGATGLATLAVFAALVLGLWNMMRNGSPRFGQTMMRWRVGLQFLAVVAIMLAVYVKRG